MMTTQDERQGMTIEEAAAFLGVSVVTVRNYVKVGYKGLQIRRFPIEIDGAARMGLERADLEKIKLLRNMNADSLRQLTEDIDD